MLRDALRNAKVPATAAAVAATSRSNVSLGRSSCRKCTVGGHRPPGKGFATPVHSCHLLLIPTPAPPNHEHAVVRSSLATCRSAARRMSASITLPVRMALSVTVIQSRSSLPIVTLSHRSVYIEACRGALRRTYHCQGPEKHLRMQAGTGSEGLRPHLASRGQSAERPDATPALWSAQCRGHPDSAAAEAARWRVCRRLSMTTLC